MKETGKIREAAFYRTTIKAWPASERPREKLLSRGVDALGEAELLALLIGSGTNGITAVDLARRLLVTHRSLSGLASATPGEICRLKGIGKATAARILAAFELGRRAAEGGQGEKPRIRSAQDVYCFMVPGLRDLKREVFKVLLLDSGNRLIRDVTVSEGTLNASLVHPREVFKQAVDHLAAAVILVHNHPSGEPSPSPDDKRITHQLVRSGEILGIPVLDHVIVARDCYFSFSEAHLLSS